MAEEARPKLAQIPQGRDVAPLVPMKQEEEDDERRPRPRPLHLSNSSNVTLPSFREAYGPALAQYPAPAPLPPPHQQPYDVAARPPGARPYPDSPNDRLGPPGPGAPPDGHYQRHQPPAEPNYRENKDYYSYSPYNHYAERAPPPHYWPQHQMPPNYQPPPPESAPRQRTSIACKYCRKRKIRCSGYQNTPDGKCTNCKKTGNDCVFQPVSSTTSTAFVPLSAIQGGVPPGTPLYGAFGQPLGPNGGRGLTNPAMPGMPNAVNSGPGGHPGPNGPPPTGYGPTSPTTGGYYQQMHPPMDYQNGHHMQQQQQQQQQHQPPPPPPPPQSASASSQPASNSAMGPRQLPLPYSQQHSHPVPQQHPGYPAGDDRMRGPSNNKRTREEEEAEFASRLPPPPPSYMNHSSSNGYYGKADDAYRNHTDGPRRSPSSMNGSVSGPGSAVSPSSNGYRGYGAPAPPVLPLPPPPPAMSSMGTDSTSVHSNGSATGTTATSPTERHDTRSPSGDVEDRTNRLTMDRFLHQPTYFSRENEHPPSREIDRTMLGRLDSSRPELRVDYRVDQDGPLHYHERAP